MMMQGICQICGQTVELVPYDPRKTSLDKVDYENEGSLFVAAEHDDPRGNRCDGSGELPGVPALLR
jgi:hypothetical protein